MRHLRHRLISIAIRTNVQSEKLVDETSLTSRLTGSPGQSRCPGPGLKPGKCGKKTHALFYAANQKSCQLGSFMSEQSQLLMKSRNYLLISFHPSRVMKGSCLFYAFGHWAKRHIPTYISKCNISMNAFTLNNFGTKTSRTARKKFYFHII